MSRCLKRLLTCMLFCGSGVLAMADDNLKAEQTFRFVYIAHNDEALGVGKEDQLLTALDEIKNTVDYSGSPCFFYLANGIPVDSLKDKPVVIRMAMEDSSQDNPDDFESTLIAELQSKAAHTFVPSIDLDNILQLLGDCDFTDNTGNIAYREVVFDFYVNPQFWKEKGNEDVISALYFILDAHRFSKDKFKMNIHYVTDTKPDFARLNGQEQKIPAMGEWNVNGIQNCWPKIELMR